MEVLTKILLEKGGVAGLFAVVVLVAIGLLIRAKGLVVFSPTSRAVPSQRLRDMDAALGRIDQRVGGMDTRLSVVEKDLANRPTRDDLHKLEMTVTRMDERIHGVESTVNKVAAGVTRIEEFLFALAKNKKDDR